VLSGQSVDPDISADGQQVVFSSTANDFVSDDNNTHSDVLLRDLDDFFNGRRRISLDRFGGDPNGASFSPSITDNGLVVAYSSVATDLVIGDTNSRRDIFLRGASPVSLLVSKDSAGGPTNDHSYLPRVDGSGAVVAFESLATDIVAGDTNGERDVFTRNLFTTTNTRVSIDDNGEQLVDDSMLLGFDDGADRVLWTNSSSAFIRDRDAGVTDLVSTTLDGTPVAASTAALSDDGRFIALSTTGELTGGDTDGAYDLYLRSYPEPRPTSISPSTVPRDQTTAVTINGRGLTDVHRVWTEYIVGPGNKISWSNLVVVDDSTITASVTVTSDAKLGPFWVNLETPDGGPGPASGSFGNCQCLTVVN
jgi:hypothetical protein